MSCRMAVAKFGFLLPFSPSFSCAGGRVRQWPGSVMVCVKSHYFSADIRFYRFASNGCRKVCIPLPVLYFKISFLVVRCEAFCVMVIIVFFVMVFSVFYVFFLVFFLGREMLGCCIRYKRKWKLALFLVFFLVKCWVRCCLKNGLTFFFSRSVY